MKSFFCLFFVLSISLCQAYEVYTFGPVADQLTSANVAQQPLSFGGRTDGMDILFCEAPGGWAQYPTSVQGLTIRATYPLNENLIMVAIGDGSYSDGIYNYDLNSMQWELNEWFYKPNFIRYYPMNSRYYVGEQQGLFQSSDAQNWTRITQLGTNKCDSFAFYENYLIVNCGTNYARSDNSGNSWNIEYLPLKGFRFASNGILYAIMDDGSDSDGIWRSVDFGLTWDVVLYSNHLACIGPEIGNLVSVGWSQPNEMGLYAAIMDPQGNLSHMNHAWLSFPVLDIDVFPLINTPSFYILNTNAFYYVTGFTTELVDHSSPVGIRKIDLYPNPAKSMLTIAFDASKTPANKLDVYNLKGQHIKSLQISKTNSNSQAESIWNLETSNGTRVNPGIYFVVLKDHRGHTLAIAKSIITH